jgi:AcrR family transcriptional regulator
VQQNKKYDSIMEAAQRLFYRYGIQKVSIEELCLDAKVSKMTFYKHFPNKIALAKRLLDVIFGNTLKRFTDMMDDPDIPFPEKMQALLQIKMEGSKDAKWAFVVDLYKSSDLTLVAHAKEWIQKGLALTVERFIRTQEQGWMRKDLNPVLMLVLLDKMQEAALDDRVIAAYRDVQDMVVEITKFFLYGISNER